LCHSLQYTSESQPQPPQQQFESTSTTSQHTWQKPQCFKQHVREGGQQHVSQQPPQSLHPQQGSLQHGSLQHGSQQDPQPQDSQHVSQQSPVHGHHGTLLLHSQQYV
jgi:hypothetical protein